MNHVIFIPFKFECRKTLFYMLTQQVSITACRKLPFATLWCGRTITLAELQDLGTLGIFIINYINDFYRS